MDAPLVDVAVKVEGNRRQAAVGLAGELPIPDVDALLKNDIGRDMIIKYFLREGDMNTTERERGNVEPSVEPSVDV